MLCYTLLLQLLGCGGILCSINQVSCGWVGFSAYFAKEVLFAVARMLQKGRKIFGYYLRSIRLRLVCHLCYANEVLFVVARTLRRDIWVVLSVN